MKKIFSKNAQYQKFEVLQSNRNKRYKYKEFLVEGVRNLNEARRSGWEFSSLLYTDEVPLSGWAREFLANVKTQENFILTHELLQELSRKDDASELMAVVKMREDSFDTLALPENPLLAVFDRPSNRGNRVTAQSLSGIPRHCHNGAQTDAHLRGKTRRPLFGDDRQ